MCPDHKPFLTEDGSPSILTTYENGVTEKMHHFRGALTESIYVYVPAVEWSLSQKPMPSIMSLGLGLGYNELLAVACAVRRDRPQPLKVVTFEADQQLSSNFKNWLTGTESTPLDATYEIVLSQIASALKIQEQTLKSASKTLFQRGDWEIRGSFPEELRPEDQFHAILYDAFSSKMDGPLWSEEHLVQFLKTHADPICAFSTYASTGALKRSLRATGFEIEAKIGFGGKKECTFATRAASRSGFSSRS